MKFGCERTKGESTVKYCPNCAQPIAVMVPPGDDRDRYVCTSCDIVHYQNPRIIVGCLVTYEDQVMLCRRAIEPRSGLWTLPAGFMENGETAEAGALRETWEEARAKPTLGHLHTIYSIPHINQVYMLYHAVLETAEFAPGPESLDVELFALDAIPWKELAFHSVDFALKRYVESPTAQRAWSGVSTFRPHRAR